MQRFVKILMNKTEVLQTEKIDEELKSISESLEFNKKMNKKIINIKVITDILIRFFIDGSKVAIVVLFGIGL
jgi:hypothetical protein